MFTKRLLVAGRMGGDVVSGQEIGAAVVVLSLRSGYNGIEGIERCVQVFFTTEETFGSQLPVRLLC